MYENINLYFVEHPEHTMHMRIKQAGDKVKYILDVRDENGTCMLQYLDWSMGAVIDRINTRLGQSPYV